ncbi:MAG: thioredoxin domain-containing protein [Candidatus Komeilibacteria bacterium]|nr:thioredoxin domain-containing protein [Candidatus Komeilibacteria bacterium]
MSEFKLSAKQENLFIRILLIIFFVFIFLIILRYFLGVKALKESQQNLEAFKKILNQSAQPTLTAPIARTTDPRLGSAASANMIVVFSDFQCPYCADLMGTLTQLIAKYPDKILLIWKDFVNQDHPEAENAAIAARCAQLQGKFWEYHGYLYANQADLGKDLYPQIAGKIGLDENKFNQCYNNQETLPLVNDEFQEGQALGLDGTPYLFVNGKGISGAVNLETLEKLIK